MTHPSYCIIKNNFLKFQLRSCFHGIFAFFRLIALWALLAQTGGSALAAPRIPSSDTEVLERLALSPGGAEANALRQLRALAAAAPRDAAVAARLARRYFDMAMAQGDPRYVGYAQAALAAWRVDAAAPVEVLVVEAMLLQYRHDFAGALGTLERALAVAPDNVEARAWRAAILMVQADYAGARRECEAMAGAASELQVAACTSYLDATTGKARAAYERLRAALAARDDVAPAFRLWVETRLAEIASRLGESATAERHFRSALALGVTDNFLLAAYADFLLDGGRAREVVELLSRWVRADTLLLRLAIAERRLGAPLATRHADALAERFAAAALRADRLHQQEEARFLLEIRGDATAALAAAMQNWQYQREPRDALILMQAALAAGRPAAARPALDWLRTSAFESEPMRRIAAQLAGQP